MQTLLQVLAQVGCFVPAHSALLRLSDCILSRMGTGDSIECNASTFTLEMKEAAYIMAALGPTSLVVLDELGIGFRMNSAQNNSVYPFFVSLSHALRTF